MTQVTLFLNPLAVPHLHPEPISKSQFLLFPPSLSSLSLLFLPLNCFSKCSLNRMMTSRINQSTYPVVIFLLLSVHYYYSTTRSPLTDHRSYLIRLLLTFSPHPLPLPASFTLLQPWHLIFLLLAQHTPLIISWDAFRASEWLVLIIRTLWPPFLFGRIALHPVACFCFLLLSMASHLTTSASTSIWPSCPS